MPELFVINIYYYWLHAPFLDKPYYYFCTLILFWEGIFLTKLVCWEYSKLQMLMEKDSKSKKNIEFYVNFIYIKIFKSFCKAK